MADLAWYLPVWYYPWTVKSLFIDPSIFPDGKLYLRTFQLHGWVLQHPVTEYPVTSTGSSFPWPTFSISSFLFQVAAFPGRTTTDRLAILILQIIFFPNWSADTKRNGRSLIRWMISGQQVGNGWYADHGSGNSVHKSAEVLSSAVSPVFLVAK